MEEWQKDFEWLRVRHLVKEQLGRDSLPDMNALLFLIGIQELGRWKEQFTKEEKQDLMHIAVCRLLSTEGYYEFEGRDADGWPHWKEVQPFTLSGVKAQEAFLKEKIIAYFDELQKEWEALK
ncbi:MAG TPA: hypothetical protein ENJ45_04115 [Phaeodactylibacter sp.]|nr:hypothetical protein [Phaeodactylibacter sp.]